MLVDKSHQITHELTTGPGGNYLVQLHGQSGRHQLVRVITNDSRSMQAIGVWHSHRSYRNQTRTEQKLALHYILLLAFELF